MKDTCHIRCLLDGVNEVYLDDKGRDKSEWLLEHSCLLTEGREDGTVTYFGSGRDVEL